MRIVHIIFLLLISFQVSSQVPQPTILSTGDFGGEQIDIIYPRIISTFDSGFIVPIQSSSSTGNINISCSVLSRRHVFNKYDATGTTLQWQKCVPYDSDSSYSYLFPLASGKYTLGGSTPAILHRDFLIKREDLNGNTIWQQRYGGSSSELLRDMAATKDRGYVMLGVSNSTDGDVGFNYNPPFNLDIWVLKLDSNGNKEWATVLGGSQNDEAFQIIPLDRGGYYVVGHAISTDHDCVGNHGGIDVFITKLDDTGGKVWSRCYGGSNDEGARMVWAVTNNHGGLTLAADAQSNNGDVTNAKGLADYWLVDIDSNGAINWNNCYGSLTSETPYGLCRAMDGTLWVTGLSYAQGGEVANSYGKGDVWTIRTDSLGNLLSAKVMGSSELDMGRVIHPLSGGGVFVAGTYGATSASGGELPNNYHGGLSDVFIAHFAPWNTGAKDIGAKTFAMQIYPNPATKELYIEPEQIDVKYDLKITDVEGKMMCREDGIKGIKTIGITGWVKGVYYLHVVADDLATYSKQIVIQ